jgi:uncharacterized protein (TIGR02271 family)
MINESPDQIIIPIREEELELKKKWVPTGEVNWHKEVLIEEKNFTVPVMREELIVEKKLIDAKSPDQSIRTETIRIPIREERVEINKHTYDLEKVEIYKHQLQQMESVEATLKKEIVVFKN